MISDQAKGLLMFLIGKETKSGKLSFADNEYSHINGHERSIEELRNAGFIKVSGNIAGIIELVPSRIKESL